jgi:farnesyl-diphosphate farnesyltransferase
MGATGIMDNAADDSPGKSGFSSNDELQQYFLRGVSRTFALTIPALPVALREPIANGYLLCRIIDTIEDDPGLNLEHKCRFSRQFIQVLKGEASASEFARELGPRLTDAIIPSEKELISYTGEVVRITHELNAVQYDALSTCVQTMAEGMMYFQKRQSLSGLRDVPEMEQYCYHVAGVVGEMLTRLYCDYSPGIAVNRDDLMRLSVNFGQGLQMTNIIKDIWEDRRRGACWLPRALFSAYGFELEKLEPGMKSKEFEHGLQELIAIAHQRLHEALEYTLLLPRNEMGIRNFCLMAIMMAVRTLKKVDQNKAFNKGSEVRISRREVKRTMLFCRMNARSNIMLRGLFYASGRGMPRSKNIGSPKTVFE